MSYHEPEEIIMCSGEQFNEIYSPNNNYYYKITNKDDSDYYGKIVDGENLREIKPQNTYITGGITFNTVDTVIEEISKIYNAEYIRKIKIPDDACVSIKGDEMKSDRIICDPRTNIADLEMWNNKEKCTELVLRVPKFIKYAKNIDEKIYGQLIEKDYSILEYISNPTEELSMLAVKKAPYSIRYLNNYSKEIFLEAIRKNEYIYRSLRKTPPMDFLIDGVRLNPKLFNEIERMNHSTELCEAAVEADGMNIKYITLKSQIICDKAILSDPKAFEYVPEIYKNEQMCNYVINRNGEMIKHVPKHLLTPEMKQKAIENNPKALIYLGEDGIDEEKIIELIRKDINLIYDIKNPSDRMLLEAAYDRPYLVSRIKNQSIIEDKRLQDFLLNQDPSAIAFLENVSEDQILRVIRSRPDLIGVIRNPSEKVLIEILKKKPLYIEQIQNKTKGMYETVISEYPLYITKLEDPDIDLIKLALSKDGTLIEFFENTSELNSIALKNNGLSLQYIEHQTEKECIMAVSQNPKAIEYVKEKTKAIYDVLVEKYPEFAINCQDSLDIDQLTKMINAKPDLIKKVRRQTPEMCEIALKNNPCNIEFCWFLTKKLVMEILKKDGLLLKFLTGTSYEEDEDVCIEAVKNAPMALKYLKKPTKKTIKIALHKRDELIKIIDKPSLSMLLIAIMKSEFRMMDASNIDPDWYKFLVLANPKSVKFIQDPIYKNECEKLLIKLKDYINEFENE